MTQIGHKDFERAIFERFLEAAPEYKADVASYAQPADDPPDILCTMNGGQRVGFELKQWLDEEQMRRAKGIERLQESILRAIGELPRNECEHVSFLWVLPKRRVRIRAGDEEPFRSELFRLIREIDTRWPQETFWHSPQGHTQGDFSRHPTLAKYLSGVKFFPQEFRGTREFRWITFPNRGGAYSERSAVNALLETIADAIDQYRGTRLGYEFNLLIHYSHAHLYNSPVETASYSIDDAVNEASAIIGDDSGMFQRIFLLMTGQPDKVYSLF